MIFEPVIAVGWREVGPKGAPLTVLYCGADVEAAAAVVNSCLDNGSIAYGRVFRGQLLGGQLMYAASTTHRPEPIGQTVYPAGG
jgi:hypothetical protein